MGKYNIIYSQFLSSLFSSVATLGLSILCLLNNQSLDIYRMLFLIKIVIPAGICAWMLGFASGKILDSYRNKLEEIRENNEKQAYEIPSIFGNMDNNSDLDNNTGELNETNGET